MIEYMNPSSWDIFYVRMAQLVANKSKDRSTKVGAVLTRGTDMLTFGFNDLPRGICDDEHDAAHFLMEQKLEQAAKTHSVFAGVMRPSELDTAEFKEEVRARREDRPYKYLWVEHGERNAINNAARLGLSTLNSTMYQNWQPTSCESCARGIIQAGVTRMIGPAIPFGGVGKGEHYDVDDVGNRLLDEAGIIRLQFDVKFLEEV